MRFLGTIGVVCLCAVLAVQARAQVATWTFENAVYGTTDPPNFGDPPAPFDVTSTSGPSINATFATQSTGTGEASMFGVHDNNADLYGTSPIDGLYIFGGRTDLGGTGGLQFEPAALKISFSQMITGLQFDFLTGSWDGDPQALEGMEPLYYDLGSDGTIDGSLTPGTQNTALFPGYWQGASGTLDMGGALFNSITLSVAPNAPQGYGEFGIDNLQVTTAVPEPGALALLFGAGLPLVWRLRRRAA